MTIQQNILANSPTANFSMSVVATAPYGTFFQGNGEGHIYVDPDGNTYIAGVYNTSNSALTASSAVMKFDPNNNLVWATYTPVGFRFGLGGVALRRPMFPDNAGNIVLCGFSPNVSNQAATYYKFSMSTGALTQCRAIAITTTRDMRFIGGAVDSNNDMYFIGEEYNPVTGITTEVVVKYLANGNYQWGKQLTAAASGSSYNPATAKILIDQSNNIYAIYSTYGTGVSPAYASTITKFDSSGNTLWQRVFSTNSVRNTDAQDSGLDAQGNIYAFLQADTNPNVAYSIVRVDPTGALTSQNGVQFTSGGFYGPLDRMQIDTANNIIYSTSTNSTASFENIYAFDYSGNYLGGMGYSITSGVVGSSTSGIVGGSYLWSTSILYALGVQLSSVSGTQARMPVIVKTPTSLYKRGVYAFSQGVIGTNTYTLTDPTPVTPGNITTVALASTSAISVANLSLGVQTVPTPTMTSYTPVINTMFI